MSTYGVITDEPVTDEQLRKILNYALTKEDPVSKEESRFEGLAADLSHMIRIVNHSLENQLFAMDVLTGNPRACMEASKDPENFFKEFTRHYLDFQPSMRALHACQCKLNQMIGLVERKIAVCCSLPEPSGPQPPRKCWEPKPPTPQVDLGSHKEENPW
jgi:hypothetical protein